MNRPRIGVILVSVREGRVGERIARWVLSCAAMRSDLSFELIDLKEWPLSPYAYALKPSQIEHEYPDDLPRRWVERVEGFDGFIAVTPEYNYSYPAQLKNVMDYALDGWKRKPIGVVSYGGMSGGLRAAEKLKATALAYGLAPIAAELAFPSVVTSFPPDANAPVDGKYGERITKLLDELAWWTNALRIARAGTDSKEANA